MNRGFREAGLRAAREEVRKAERTTVVRAEQIIENDYVTGLELKREDLLR